MLRDPIHENPLGGLGVSALPGLAGAPHFNIASDLRKFYECYYSDCHDPPEKWPETYHRTPLGRLPHCARHILEHPNDLLMKPAGIQLVTRCLLADNWHPRHVAGLIRSKFEEPSFGWGAEWTIYDPATRADPQQRVHSSRDLFLPRPPRSSRHRKGESRRRAVPESFPPHS